MRRALTMMPLPAMAALSTMLLAGCALAPKPVTAVVVACPELPPPTEHAVDALERAGESLVSTLSNGY